MKKTGALYLYDSERSFLAGKAEWAERQRHGVEVREVSVDEARAMVPALAGPFAKAFFAPDYWTVSSPSAILSALRRRIATAGSLLAQEVVGLRSDANAVSVITAEGGDLPYDRAVVAGGVWSRDLVRMLGLSVSLETERGYNTTFPNAPVEIPVPLFFVEHGFVATPLADGLRVGGAVELAAVDAPPNLERGAGDAEEDAPLRARSARGRRQRVDGVPAVDAGFACR